MTEQPHVTLNRAADVLEERAGKATLGPWTLWDRGVGYEINELPDCHDGTTFYRGDAEWIATMDPPKAAPLVALLRTTAQYARALAVLQDPHVDQDMHVEHALTFARMVLGEGQ